MMKAKELQRYVFSGVCGLEECEIIAFYNPSRCTIYTPTDLPQSEEWRIRSEVAAIVNIAPEETFSAWY